MPSTGIEARLNGHDMEQVRQDFVHQYVSEEKTLEKVMSYFEQRGIVATRQQWKTQITKWKIGKQNRESDMLFAQSKARSRRAKFNKDTVFVIRGQRRTMRDIERYFQRKPRVRKVPRSQTPEGVTYFTPLSSPLLQHVGPIKFSGGSHLQTSDRPERDNLSMSRTMNEGDDDGQLLSDLEHILASEYSVQSGNRRQELFHLTTISLPTDPYSDEAGLSAFRYCYASSLDHFADKDNTLAYKLFNIDSFAVDMFSAMENFRAGYISTAKSYWLTALKVLPQTLRENNPTHFNALMGALSQLVSFEYLKHGKRVLQLVAVTIQRCRRGRDPLVTIITALCRSPHPKDLLEAAFMFAKDYTTQTQCGDQIQWMAMQRALYNCYHTNIDSVRKNAAYTALVDAIDLYIGQSKGIDHENICYYFDHVNLLVERERYDDAATTVRLLETFLEQQPNPETQNQIDLLWTRGTLGAETGEPGAIEDLERALQLARDTYGPADFETLRCARSLNSYLQRVGSVVESYP